MHNRNSLDHNDHHDHRDYCDHHDHRDDRTTTTVTTMTNVKTTTTTTTIDHPDQNRLYCSHSGLAVKPKNFKWVPCYSASHNYNPKVCALFLFDTRALRKERNS